jgi:hypothetical protein
MGVDVLMSFRGRKKSTKCKTATIRAAIRFQSMCDSAVVRAGLGDSPPRKGCLLVVETYRLFRFVCRQLVAATGNSRSKRFTQKGCRATAVLSDPVATLGRGGLLTGLNLHQA